MGHLLPILPVLGQAQGSPQNDSHGGLEEEATSMHGNGEGQEIRAEHPQCLLPTLVYGLTFYNKQRLLSLSHHSLFFNFSLVELWVGQRAQAWES